MLPSIIYFFTLCHLWEPIKAGTIRFHSSDGKRLDGVTMVPLKHDKPLVCDATCLDSLASLYCGLAISSAVAAE